MKHYIIHVGTALISCLLIGCSTTYRITDSLDKKDFVKRLNEFSEKREMIFTLKNDSAFCTNEGSFIQDDTLFTMTEFLTKNRGAIPVSDLKAIEYKDNSFKSAQLNLVNGKSLNVEDLEMTNDSITYQLISSEHIKTYAASFDQIKSAQYVDKWKRFPLGIIGGVLTGLVTGGTIAIIMSYGNQSRSDDSPAIIFFASPVVGAIIGTCLNFIFGYTYTFDFNR